MSHDCHMTMYVVQARQVQEVFPTVPLSSVVDDLRMTHSVELTIENIIEGRVTIPPVVSTQLETLKGLY